MVQHNGLISDFAFVRCTHCDWQTGLEGFLVSEIACMIMHLHTPGHSVLAVLNFCLFCASGFLCLIMLLSFVFSLCLDVPHFCCTLWFLNGVPSSLALMWKVMFFSFIKWNFTKFLVDKNGQPVKRYSPNTEPFVSDSCVCVRVRMCVNIYMCLVYLGGSV